MAEKNAVLITGASGFIGLRLASFLSNQGAEVHAVVRPESRIDELRALRNVSIHATDGSTRGLVKILGEAAPRCVYHLASLFVGEHTPDDVTSLVASNIQFGAQLLEAMKETATPGLVTAGTSWQHFEEGAARPVNLYAATKVAFEDIARYYADAYHLRAITLKLFDSYGPGDKRRKLFWHLRRTAETGERVAMSGGEQILEMLYVDDVVRAFVVAGQRISMMTPSTVEAYRAPSQQPMTLRKIAEIYGQVVGRALNLEWGGRAYRPREVFQPWSGDPILPGWQASVSLEQGIRLMEGIEGVTFSLVMSKNRQIALGLFGSVLFAVVNLGVTFLQFRLIVAYLAPEAAGLWMLFLSMIGYLILLDIGLSPTLGREISFALGDVLLSEEERNLRVAQLIHSGQRVLLALSLLVIAVGSAIGCVYLRTVSSPSMLHQAQLAWVILTVGAAFNLIGEIWFAALYGMGRVASEKIIRCVGQILWLMLTVTAIFLHSGLIGLAVAWLIQGLVVRFLAKYFFHSQCKMLSRSVSFDLDLVRSLVGPSLKYAATALGGVLILQTDNIIIASVMGTTQIPGYQAVSKLVTTLMSLSMMLVVTTTPFISQAYSQGRMDEIKRLLYRNLRVSLSVLIICGALVAGFADRIISVWLGPHQFVGFGVVWILLAVMILEAHHVAMATAVMATGKIVFVVPAMLAGVLNIVFSVFLAHKFGLFGVALGTMCAQVLTNNWYVPFYTMRHFGIQIREHASEVFAPIAKLIFAVSITSGLCRLATFHMRDVFSLAISGCSIFTIGISVFYFSLLSAKERGDLSSFFARFRRIGASASQLNR